MVEELPRNKNSNKAICVEHPKNRARKGNDVRVSFEGWSKITPKIAIGTIGKKKRREESRKAKYE